jgi:predicted nucleotidyltransferase
MTDALILKTRLPVEHRALLRVMQRVADAVGLRYFVVGATARDILMYHLHGLPINRASPDIDFAMAIESWDIFDRVKASLLSEPGFRSDSKIIHRVHFSPPSGDGFPVDLVPFGGVESTPRTVAWPPDMKVVMNVAGYAEALESAIRVRVDEQLVIPVASIPGLVITKLIAWLDRGHINAKDAVDFRYLIENYADAGNLDRLYGEEAILFAACDYVIERAGPRLLGFDIASIASDVCKAQIVGILTAASVRDRLVVGMLRGAVQRDDAYGALQDCLGEFETGLTVWGAGA